MRHRFFCSRMAAVVAVVLCVPVRAAGQAPGAAPNPWTPPLTADGQPDIQGYWDSGSGKKSFESYTLEGVPGSEEHTRITSGQVRGPLESVVIDPPDGRIPYQPWALARRNEIAINSLNPTKLEHIDGRLRCLLPGVPRQVYEIMPRQAQILQQPGLVVMLSEFTHAYRVIRLDGRPHLGDQIKLWQGDSRGRWEGDTLVVDVTNQIGKWLDVLGDFHSDAVHVVERFTYAAADTIRYEATIEDSKVYTRPWKVAFILSRHKEAGFELMESACHEGNPDFRNIFFRFFRNWR